MSLSNRKIGIVVQWVGWFTVAHTLLTYGHTLYGAKADASVRAYAVLIALEGLVILGAGLVIVWFGRRVARTLEPNAPDQSEGHPPE